jgi:hypothetical protein
MQDDYRTKGAELVKQLLQQHNMEGAALEYEPTLDSSERRPLLSESDPSPTKLHYGIQEEREKKNNDNTSTDSEPMERFLQQDYD